ncbi:DUF7519 family protein [Salinilacihabitans rarus]|uniref:DUF7519 family protein n=1 Tax=Salinilacihabitans rarus TaxID=2961596 RepID=UPI0020C89DC2|nr:hypothetical protein [Salinilacihabitans rarus]
MSEIVRRPTTVAAGVAGVAALVAVAAAGLGSTAGLALGAIGAAGVAAGLARGARPGVDVGCLVLFLGVVAGGLGIGSVELTLIGTVATVVAWDLAQGAIDLGDQLGRGARTARLEAVHAVSSLLVGLTAAAAGYAVYLVGAGGRPVSAAVLLLIAAILLTVGLGSGRSRNRRRR